MKVWKLFFTWAVCVSIVRAVLDWERLATSSGEQFTIAFISVLSVGIFVGFGRVAWYWIFKK
jgi:hypothetical protein